MANTSAVDRPAPTGGQVSVPTTELTADRAIAERLVHRVRGR
ncbi:hypothetical protein [Streptosporangium sp. 'caverna']|nr:hypothetical protein [Streptosporangium sp. 'caverna']